MSGLHALPATVLQANRTVQRRIHSAAWPALTSGSKTAGPCVVASGRHAHTRLRACRVLQRASDEAAPRVARRLDVSRPVVPEKKPAEA